METIKDIVREMRERCIDKNHSPNLWEYIDRIEAAYKHEVDGYKGRIKLWSDRADELRRKCDEQYAELKRKRKAVTNRNHLNCAKLREAVEAVVEVGYPHNFQRENPNIRRYCCDITKAIKKCFDALAAPPRNCDRQYENGYDVLRQFTAETGRQIFDTVDVINWLFAKAKGEEK